MLLSFALVAGFVARPVAAQSAAADGADLRIADEVRTVIAADERTWARHIEVTSCDGIVRLSGAVDSLAIRKSAARAAGGVPGVRRVENQLVIR